MADSLKFTITIDSTNYYYYGNNTWKSGSTEDSANNFNNATDYFNFDTSTGTITVNKAALYNNNSANKATVSITSNDGGNYSLALGNEVDVYGSGAMWQYDKDLEIFTASNLSAGYYVDADGNIQYHNETTNAEVEIYNLQKVTSSNWQSYLNFSGATVIIKDISILPSSSVNVNTAEGDVTYYFAFSSGVSGVSGVATVTAEHWEQDGNGDLVRKSESHTAGWLISDNKLSISNQTSATGGTSLFTITGLSYTINSSDSTVIDGLVVQMTGTGNRSVTINDRNLLPVAGGSVVLTDTAPNDGIKYSLKASQDIQKKPNREGASWSLSGSSYIYTAATLGAYGVLSGDTLTYHAADIPGWFSLSGLSSNLSVGTLSNIAVYQDDNAKTFTITLNNKEYLAQKDITVSNKQFSTKYDNYKVNFDINTEFQANVEGTASVMPVSSGTITYKAAKVTKTGYYADDKNEQVIYYKSLSPGHSITISGLSSGWTVVEADNDGNIYAKLVGSNKEDKIAEIKFVETKDGISNYNVKLFENAIDKTHPSNIKITSTTTDTRFTLEFANEAFKLHDSETVATLNKENTGAYKYSGAHYLSGFTKTVDQNGALSYIYHATDTAHAEFTLTGLSFLTGGLTSLSGTSAIEQYLTVGGDSTSGYTVTLSESALTAVSAINSTTSSIILTKTDGYSYTLGVSGVNTEFLQTVISGSFSAIANGGYSFVAPTYEGYYSVSGATITPHARTGGDTVTFSLSNVKAYEGTFTVTAMSGSSVATVTNASGSTLFTATGVDTDNNGTIDRYDFSLSKEFLNNIQQGGYIAFANGSGSFISTDDTPAAENPVTGASFIWNSGTFNFSASVTQPDKYEFTSASVAHVAKVGGQPFALTGGFSSAVMGQTFSVENDGTIKLDNQAVGFVDNQGNVYLSKDFFSGGGASITLSDSVADDVQYKLGQYTGGTSYLGAVQSTGASFTGTGGKYTYTSAWNTDGVTATTVSKDTGVATTYLEYTAAGASKSFTVDGVSSIATDEVLSYIELNQANLKDYLEQATFKDTGGDKTVKCLKAGYYKLSTNLTIDETALELTSVTTKRITLGINSDVVIDLNGHEITSSGWGMTVGEGGNLTVNDSVGNGKINGTQGIAVYPTPNNGSYDGKVHARLTVNGGTIKGQFGIFGNGNSHGTEITINNGTIIGDIGIYQPQEGKLVINNGIIETNEGNNAESAIEIRSGELYVNGGTIKSNASDYSCNPNGNGTTTVGAALAIAQHTTNNVISVNITGGTFKGVTAVSIANPEKKYRRKKNSDPQHHGRHIHQHQNGRQRNFGGKLRQARCCKYRRRLVYWRLEPRGKLRYQRPHRRQRHTLCNVQRQ